MGELVHACCVAVRAPAGWRGVLIRGASGSGKSDLALRLVNRPGWRLVADDYAHVWASGGALWARAPERIAGLIEVRGLGVIAAERRTLSRLVLLVDAAHASVERFPEPETEDLLGVRLPRLTVALKHASAVELVAAATAKL